MSTGKNGRVSQGQDYTEENITDGPSPMRNFKPAKTTPNCVDQFWQTHQAEYEERGRRSPDPVERVRLYNTAYPALRDELDRRRSISKVTAVKARGRIDLDSICSDCLRQRGITNRNTFRSRGHDRRRNRYRRNEREYRSRTCRRTICRNRRYRYINRGCQCGTPAIDNRTERKQCIQMNSRQTSNHSMNSAKGLGSSQPTIKGKSTSNKGLTREKSVYSPQYKNGSGSEVGSLKSPCSNKPSMSSYNSFLSIDHEPMVS